MLRNCATMVMEFLPKRMPNFNKIEEIRWPTPTPKTPLRLCVLSHL